MERYGGGVDCGFGLRSRVSGQSVSNAYGAGAIVYFVVFMAVVYFLIVLPYKGPVGTVGIGAKPSYPAF
jgi:hypothetical protein